MTNTMTGLDYKIREMAGRIRELREIEGKTPEEMAQKTDVTVSEYLACENGESDLNFAFIYRCALALGVNVTDIIEGQSPKLKSFTLTRSGGGEEIANAHGMTYFNLAYAFQNRIAEPLYVKSVFTADAQSRDVELTTHEGQELDIVISGQLLVQIGEHSAVLNPGDSIYFNSSTPHGMIAVGGQDCEFYAIVLNPTGAPIPELEARPAAVGEKPKVKVKDTKKRIWQNFIDVTEDEMARRRALRSKIPNALTLPSIWWTRLPTGSRKSLLCCISPKTKQRDVLRLRISRRPPPSAPTTLSRWASKRETVYCWS